MEKSTPTCLTSLLVLKLPIYAISILPDAALPPSRTVRTLPTAKNRTMEDAGVTSRLQESLKWHLEQ
jgi:hypothetical protein